MRGFLRKKLVAARTAPPCGRCRELIAQLDEANAETAVVLDPDRVVPLMELLPEYWL